MTATLIALLLVAQVDVEACRDAPPRCREAAGRAVLLERAIAETRQVDLGVCLEKLGSRTSTVVRELVPAALPSSPTPPGHGVEVVIAVAAVVAVVFAFAGYAVGAAGAKVPQTVVVR